MKFEEKYIVEVLVSGIRKSKKEIIIPADLDLEDYEDLEDYIEEVIWDGNPPLFQGS